MQAIRLAKTPSEKGLVKAKCLDAMSRAEEIKEMKQWPLNGVPDEGQANPRKLVLKAPTSTRGLDAKERLILLKSSRLHGSIFAQWTGEPSREEFTGEKGLYT